MAKLTGIEAARGSAATAVVLYHVARHLAKAHGSPLQAGVFQFGHAGVDLFFVISGFIITYVHYGDIGRAGALGHYAERRFTRVMPTYWVALIITILLSAMGHAGAPPFGSLFWSVSLIPSDHPLLLELAWTLRYEVFFYAVFATLIWNRRAGAAVLAGWILLVAASISGLASFAWLPESIHSAYNGEFLMGMAAGFWIRRHTVVAPRLVLLLGVSLFAAVALAENANLLNGYADWARLAYGLPSAVIILGLAEAGRQDRLAVPRWLQVLGSASYSIYLFQFAFIGIAWQVLLAAGLYRALPAPVVFVLLAVPGVGGGVVMSLLVEQPLMRALRGQRARGRQPVPAA